MVVIRSENPEELQKFATGNGIPESVAVGSALKYSLLAAAEFEIFPRLVESSEGAADDAWPTVSPTEEIRGYSPSVRPTTLTTSNGKNIER